MNHPPLPEPPHPTLRWVLDTHNEVHGGWWSTVVDGAHLEAADTVTEPSGCEVCGMVTWYPYGVGCVNESCAGSPHRYATARLTEDGGWDWPVDA